MNKRFLGNWFWPITYGGLMVLIVMNIQNIISFFQMINGILTPFYYAVAFAFVLNRLYKYLVFLLNKIKTKRVMSYKLKKYLSITITYILFLIFLSVILWFVIPQLVDSLTTLVNNSRSYALTVYNFLNRTIVSLGIEELFSAEMEKLWLSLPERLSDIVTFVSPYLINFFTALTGNLYNIIIGFFISIYFLSGKERLLSQINRIAKAFLPERAYKNVSFIAASANRTFGGYITGQLTDAIIVGTLCFIGTSLLNIPFALLISVIVCVTNVIPMFGPIIGAVPAAFIVLMADPIKALWFIIFIIVLQQIDGNILVPRIVGNSIGLSGLWVIFSIVVGGGLFGFVGMVLAVPTFAVIYTLLRSVTSIREDSKRTKSDVIITDPDISSIDVKKKDLTEE